MKNVSKTIKTATAKIQTSLSIKLESYINNSNPASRSAFFTGAALVTGAQSAFAQTGGFAGTASTVAEQGKGIADSAGTIFAAIGFIIAGWGGLNMYKRSRETRDDGAPQTPITKIVGPMVAGAVLAATGAFMITGGETLGVQETDYGTVPNK
ncbi:hypothetical protein [Halomonas campaniensis]|uniref:hypothetical protein n=1 Tax=Halomonas campaniensis TaxID=213554 RepID=UPI000B52A6A9|nr:hypothetical protein [Halomonas campaniensis]